MARPSVAPTGFCSTSSVPRVRTLQREFITSSRVTMPLLQLTQVGDLGGGHYVSAYGGMLEYMYGGVGSEWLYRPWHGRLAWGVDVNHVRQRDFRQGLQFRDYRVSTGHATMYWDTGWNDVQVNLSAGRYLAGDLGATLDVKRVFANGVALGPDLSYVLHEPKPRALETLGSTTATLGQQIADVPSSTWLWLGGAVLASSLLDKPVDRWAANRQTPSWNRAGTAANGLTYGLVVGAGLLYTGIAGEGAASTVKRRSRPLLTPWAPALQHGM